MIKGWKLDPAWRDYYERRNREKLERADRMAHLRFIKTQIDCDRAKKAYKIAEDQMREKMSRGWWQ